MESKRVVVGDQDIRLVLELRVPRIPAKARKELEDALNEAYYANVGDALQSLGIADTVLRLKKG